MNIKFLDLKKLNTPYEKDFKLQFDSFLESGYYILGNSVSKFELEFATYCDTKYCIGTGNGLDALTLIIKGYIQLGIFNIGDQVIVASNTYIATVLAIINAGLKPILIDINKHTYNLDPTLLPTIPSKKIKAIMVTHLYGQVADMEKLQMYCKTHKLLLLADAAQSHGAMYKNQNCGSLADATAFSFYPTKNLGALGDGGAITTNNTKLNEVLLKLRNYGRISKYENDCIGVNSRLDEIQAGFLSLKLKKLNHENSLRRKIAKRYITEINNPEISLPRWDLSNNHVFYLFVIRVTNRVHFIEYLKVNGIQSEIHYPIPVYEQKAFEGKFPSSFPVTSTTCLQIVSIPLNPALSTLEISYIILTLNNYAL